MSIVEIEVINWEKYNPRTDRKKSSWFRLENGIASEPKFFGLSAAQRFCAICFFAEASKNCGSKASIDIPWLADQLKIKEAEIHQTIQRLVERGVVKVSSGDVVVSSGCPTNERTNERTDGHKAWSGDQLPLIALIWNKECVDLPKVRRWSEDREKEATKLRADFTDGDWLEACRLVQKSDFLSGRNEKWTNCAIGWLMNPKNITKVLEGNYNRKVKEIRTIGGVCEI